MNTILDVEYASNVKLDVYLPNNKNFKTIVYFHGGGITSGNKNDKQFVDFADIFTKNGYAFVSCNYSLYPNTKFPNYLIEAAKAVSYVFNNVTQWGGDKEGIYLSGQSAGSWIIMMLCTNKKYLLDEGVNPMQIKGWISDAGQMTSHFNVISIEDHLNPLSQRIDEKAPLFYVDETFDCNPILLIYYEKDMPNRLEQNQLFVSAVKNFNPNIEITPLMLPGTHCHGSCIKNEDGTYDYVNASLQWLKTH